MAATWNELPESVRVAVQQHVGTVARVVEIHEGLNNDVAAVLHRAEGDPVFLKGVEGPPSRRMRFLRNEATAGELAPGIAPGVVFAEDVDGWLVVGFEYVAGRPADFTPDSPDLPLVASTVERIGALPAGSAKPLADRWNADWWGRLAEEGSASLAGWDVEVAQRRAKDAPGVVAGDRLAHTDLHPDQFIMAGDGSVHVIDWGFPAAAAPWVDGAFLILRLIDAGHAPLRAEEWARSLACFRDVEPEAVTAFMVYVAGMWTHWADHDPVPGKLHRAQLVRDYAAWRVSLGW